MALPTEDGGAPTTVTGVKKAAPTKRAAPRATPAPAPAAIDPVFAAWYNQLTPEERAEFDRWVENNKNGVDSQYAWGDGPPPAGWGDHSNAPATTSSAPATTSNAPGTPGSADAVTDYARATYGYLASYLDHPEIGPILRQASTEQWSQERLYGALTATSWWRTTSATARQWDEAKNSDPATAAQNIDSRTAELSARALQLGVNLSGSVLRDLAERSLRLGWNTTQIDNAVGSAAAQDPTAAQQLASSSIASNVNRLLGDYALPMSDSARTQWVNQIASGTASLEQMRSWAVAQSSAMYPSLANSIRSGVSVRQYVDPYLQIAQQTLGVSSDAMDLSDGRWLAALDVTQPGGERRPMTFDEWRRRLKTDPQYGYEYTNDARDGAYRLAANIGKMFGVSA